MRKMCKKVYRYHVNWNTLHISILFFNITIIQNGVTNGADWYALGINKKKNNQLRFCGKLI